MFSIAILGNIYFVLLLRHVLSVCVGLTDAMGYTGT